MCLVKGTVMEVVLLVSRGAGQERKGSERCKLRGESNHREVVEEKMVVLFSFYRRSSKFISGEIEFEKISNMRVRAGTISTRRAPSISIVHFSDLIIRCESVHSYM